MSHRTEAAAARRERMCARWKAGVEVKLIAQEFGVQNPAIWRALRKAGLLPPYAPKVPGGPGKPRAPKAVPEAGPAAPLVLVERNPCPRCGVRGDVGCAHRRATPAQVIEPFKMRGAVHMRSNSERAA
jgi:hypothetical protein